MLFPVFDSRPVSVGLKAGVRWLNWSRSTPFLPVWESPFSAAAHLQPCEACADFTGIQEAIIDDHALYSADSIVLFADGEPISVMAIPPNVFVEPFGAELPPPLIGDPDFEQVQIGAGKWAYRVTGSPWTFAGNAGLSANGSAFTSGNPPAPEGAQVAILQSTGSLTQAVEGWAAGSYVLTFAAAQRGNQPSRQDFTVLIDGAAVGLCLPHGKMYQTYTTAVFTVTDGSHTIAFQGLNTAGGDNTAFIDSVLQVAFR